MNVASILSIFRKKVDYDKKLEIYTNGADNAYAESMDAFIANSVTASMASAMMQDYLIGKGFGEVADAIEINGVPLIDLAQDSARDLTNQKGVWVHFDVDANFDYSGFKIIPFNQCRLGKKDSKDYNGKILVYKDWTAKKIDPKDISVIDVFNPNKKVIEAQVNACKGKTLVEKIANYKGQILFFNTDRRTYYPLSRIDSVASECDSEYLASRYKNVTLRNGFFGKTLVVTRPLIENNLIEQATSGNLEAIRNLKLAESEKEAFQKGIENFIGAEDVGGVMHLEVDFAGEKLEDAILFKNVESNINDQMFSYTENSAMAKILMVFKNLPIALVKSPDSALLGNSGEAIRVAKETYWENTSRERDLNTRILTFALNQIPKYKDVSLNVVPLLSKEVSTDTATLENQKAQATLKGSVGGVQALLAIQQGVSAGTTTKDSAVKIIEVIFGIDPATAEIMLGTPIKDASTVPTIKA